jgi:anti-anti-sigma regulatory factor
MKKRTKAAPAKKTRRPSATKAAVLALPAECTTADAGALKTRLQKLLMQSQVVTLDRSAVQRVDTATLQMLAAFLRDRRAEGLDVEWSGEAAAFTSAARLLGLSSLL